MDIAITGSQFIGGLVATIVVIAGLVLLFRNYLANTAKKDLAGKYGDSNSLRLKKYPEADVFKFSGTFLRVGLVAAVGLLVLAFGWTQYEEKIDLSGYTMDLPDDIEVEIPRSAEPPPPPPPPPPPVIEEVPDDVIEEEVDLTDIFNDEDDLNLDVDLDDAMSEVEAPPPPPEPEPEPEPEIEEIFTVVEQMPRFPGCEDISGTDEEKSKCAEKKMLEFIYKNIKYPAIARENGVEGTVVIRFMVDKDGSIKKATALRDIGAGCGEEALRVVEMMNNLPQKWTPGKQRNQNVKVWFNLPVRFKLEN